MNPTSIVLHHKWKTGEKSALLSDDNIIALQDLDGKEISCVGTCISPKSMEQCQSTISTLHKA
jgi:hypothetical protein